MGWIVRTATNECVSAWRRRQRDLPLEAGDRAVPEPSGHQAVLDLLSRHLDDRERQVVAMDVLFRMPTREIAEELGYSAGVVRMLRNRGFAKLRKGIARDHGEL